jgi:hypothetical protein
MTQAITPSNRANESDPEQVKIVGEEERTLTRIQKHLVARAEEMRLNAASDFQIDYDAELISLRDQIQPRRGLEDLPPLIAEMYRLQAVAARTPTRRRTSRSTSTRASPTSGTSSPRPTDARRSATCWSAAAAS